MTLSLDQRIRIFLKTIEKDNKVISYGFLAKKFSIAIRKLTNLLRIKLYDVCHVVVGCIKNIFLITSSSEMMNYQLKKLKIEVSTISIIDDPAIIKAITSRLKHNFQSITEKRIISINDVCYEELAYKKMFL